MANKLIAIVLWVFAAALVGYDVYLIAIGQAEHGFYVYPIAFVAFGVIMWVAESLLSCPPPPDSYLNPKNLPKDRPNGFD